MTTIGSPMMQARAALLRELPDNAWFDVAMMPAGYGHRDVAVVFQILSELVAVPPGRTLEWFPG